MKKTKLFTTLCTLVLTLACLAFGVYAAVSATFSVTGTITFHSYNLDCTMDVTILGLAPSVPGATASGNRYAKTLKYATTDARATGGYTKLTTTMDLGQLVFDELNTQITDAQRSQMTISITLKNYSTYKVQLSGTEGTVTGCTITVGSAITAEASSNGTTPTNGSAEFTITLQATGAMNSLAANIANLTLAPYSA